MTRSDAIDFIRRQRLAVIATVTADGAPEAALMGIAMTSDERIVFDTFTTTRKYANLRARNTVALVVGWDDEVTVQIEGIAEEPTGEDLERCKDAYFAAYPEGRERASWPDIAYLAVRITWMRYCDYGIGGAGVLEFTR